jgi:hypothetical protein
MGHLGRLEKEPATGEPLTISQRVLQARLMRPALLAEGKRRQGLAGSKDRDRALPKHSTREALARYCGLSGRTFDKALAVIEAAQNNPERYAGVIKQMDATGNVDRAYSAVAFAEGRRDMTQDEIFVTTRIGKKRLGNFTASEVRWLIGFFGELGEHLDRCATGYAYDLFTVAQVRRALARAKGFAKLPPKQFAKSKTKRGAAHA